MHSRSTLAVAAILLALGSASGEMSAVIRLGDVAFPHELHFDSLELGCGNCHHETRAAALNVPHEQYFDDLWANCVACHRPAGGEAAPVKCSSCHHESPASTADETLSAKVVIHRSCWACHDVGRGVEASRSCAGCHSGKESTE